MRFARKLSLEERKTGCVLGAAVGDALGMPTEFISPRDHLAHFNGRIEEFARAPKGHPCSHLEPGQWTDDTQQLLALAESISSNHGQYSHEAFAKTLGKWWEQQHESEHRRWPGTNSLASTERLFNGISPLESGSRTTNACGSVMRVAPIGLAYRDPGEARRAGAQSSIPTHNSEVCRQSAAAVAEIISRLVHRNETPAEAVKNASKNVSSKDVRSMLELALRHSRSDPDTALREIGSDSSALQTMGYAVYSFLHSPNDFRKVVVTAANAVPGDTDSVACVAGALAGAYNGKKAIPASYLANLERRVHLEEIAKKL
jgi:ADP-ribosylglycohydrolase